MSINFLNCRPFLLLASLAVGALVPANAQQPPKKGRAIVFSDPKSETVTSNLDQTASSKTTLRTLDDQFKKPFSIFVPGDAENGGQVPPMLRLAPSASQSKRAKELREKRKDWVFLSPEDSEFGLSLEAMFNIPEYDQDGRVKQKGTPLERYYERLEHQRTAGTNQSNAFGMRRKGDEANELGFFGAEVLPGARSSDTDQILKRLSNKDSAGTLFAERDGKRNSYDASDFGGVIKSDLAGSREGRLEEFKQLLEAHALPSPAPGAMDLNGMAASTPRSVVPGGFKDSSSSGDPNSPKPVPYAVGSPLGPQGLPEATASPGYPSLAPTLPAPTPAPETKPPQPTFTAPRRKF